MSGSPISEYRRPVLRDLGTLRDLTQASALMASARFAGASMASFSSPGTTPSGPSTTPSTPEQPPSTQPTTPDAPGTTTPTSGVQGEAASSSPPAATPTADIASTTPSMTPTPSTTTTPDMGGVLDTTASSPSGTSGDGGSGGDGGAAGTSAGTGGGSGGDGDGQLAFTGFPAAIFAGVGAAMASAGVYLRRLARRS